MDEIINPHDKLFRETWSDLPTAKSFLQHPRGAVLTALDTLEISKNTFIANDLKEFFCDLPDQRPYRRITHPKINIDTTKCHTLNVEHSTIGGLRGEGVQKS